MGSVGKLQLLFGQPLPCGKAELGNFRNDKEKLMHHFILLFQALDARIQAM